MKKLTLLFACLCISMIMLGQGEDIQRFRRFPVQQPKKYHEPAITPYLFLGPGMGINNYTGLIGGAFEVPIVPHFSAFLIGGIGGWGYKVGGGVTFYLRKWEYLGSAFSLGIANAFGDENHEASMNLEGQENLESVTINLNDAPTLNLTYHYHFSMGRISKFVIGGGYAFALVDSPYSLVDPENAQLSSDSERTMKLLQPGGLIISIAFQFGVGDREKKPLDFIKRLQ